MGPVTANGRAREVWDAVVMPVLLAARPSRIAVGGVRTPLSKLLEQQGASEESFSLVEVGSDSGPTPCELALVGINGDQGRSRRVLAALERHSAAAVEAPLVLLFAGAAGPVDTGAGGLLAGVTVSSWDFMQIPGFPELGVLVPRRGRMSELRSLVGELPKTGEERPAEALSVVGHLVAHLRQQLESLRGENLRLRRDVARARQGSLDQRIEAGRARMESFRLAAELEEARRRLAVEEEREDAAHARDELARRLRLLVARSDELESRTAVLGERLAEAERERDALRAGSQVVLESAPAPVEAALALAHTERALTSMRKVRESRAWRGGHGVTRLLRYLSFRKPVGAGGVDAAIGELELVVQALERTAGQR